MTTSLFCCPADNYGKPRTFRQILFSDFAVSHEWYYKVYNPAKWINGHSNDLETTIRIRKGVSDADKIYLKQTLQCFTPSGNYKCKKKSGPVLIHTNPILQLDFDALESLDIEDVKRAIFSLPFVCYAGLSVSGKAIFALVLISEPDKLKDYAEHCFVVFNYYGLPPDTTKGRNYSDLRFVSYDANALYREDPKPLTIKKFYAFKKEPVFVSATGGPLSDSTLINWAVKSIQNAIPGDGEFSRFKTVRKVAYTLGGHGIGLNEIKQAICNAAQYSGVTDKYLTHAEEGFAAGQKKAIIR